MQQIRKAIQKTYPFVEHFCILYQMTVQHIDLSWNTIEPSPMLMHQKLVAVGLAGILKDRMEADAYEAILSLWVCCGA
jgi:hypothetical protein